MRVWWDLINRLSIGLRVERSSHTDRRARGDDQVVSDQVPPSPDAPSEPESVPWPIVIPYGGTVTAVLRADGVGHEPMWAESRPGSWPPRDQSANGET